MSVRAAALVCLFGLVATTVRAADPAPAQGAEALWDAARQGDLATVKRLVEGGLDVNTKTKYGATALSYACDRGHLDVVTYLVEKGADVNGHDSFYQASPMTWALYNDHYDIVALLIAKGAKDADQALDAGVRAKSVALVKAALASASVTPDAVLSALGRAKQAGDVPEIVALIEASGIELPQVEAVAVDAAELESYVGKYKNEEIGLGLDVRVEDGALVAQATDQPPLHLRATADDRFAPVEAPQIKIAFSGKDGAIDTVTIDQGGRTYAFPRVTAAANTAAASPSAGQALPPAERTSPQAWPSFRGPGASGIGDGQGAPTEWDVATGKNVQWKTAIPGIANSSPIVWGDLVFVTTAISGANDDTFRTGLYGDVDSVEDLSEHTFKVYALDRKSGEIVWERTAAVKVPGAKRHMKASQANSTPVTDGKRVVALFGTIGLLVAYDMKGKELWRADTGTLDSGWFYDKSYQWGHASSPVIYKDLVIVQADIQSDSFLAAWSLEDGKPAWRTQRDEVPTWGTPTLYLGKTGDELITNGTTIRGYDPASGKELWRLGPNSEVTVATPVVAGTLFYVTAGYTPVQPIYAIKAGSRGDLSLPEKADSSAAIAWSKSRGGTYLPTPIVYRDQLYTCSNNGVLTAYDARSGTEVFKARVGGGGGSFTASPIAADGKLYFTSEEGDVIVVRAGATYEELARNTMGEVCMSTPAVADGVMVVRTMQHVYGLAETPEARATGESPGAASP